MANAKRRSPWKAELDDLMRAIAGAFLFGAPFLYTMEVWWKGNFTKPPRMLLLLGIAYAVLILLNLQGGFRKGGLKTWIQIFTEAVEALAIALVCVTFSLILIGVIRFETGLEAIMGRIITEALPFSLGVGIANNVLLAADEDNNNSKSEGKSESKNDGNALVESDQAQAVWYGTLADAGATALGAIIVSASIAPTDEIPMISSMISIPWLLIIIAVSLLLSYIIVFQASFGGQATRRSQPGFFQSPMSETFASYLISLLVALSMLWLFQLVHVGDPMTQWVSYTLVLGFPATIGGAAGRLAL
ncbi:MAG: TIGR02587 family membrane protein [Oscillatoriophycideae cyanobacterium NC_groundwater_1537_Pr4_S-0.65um_50_18]|nr:TIGR02587 family membrane protein [Oscillatoriophycideae cyanobacterium NC_groundwater_1537_Pr4_S-0.65um_50_18]